MWGVKMSNYRIVYSGTLSHHGIKGQKWGNRRFQNDDGSLTEEGKRRYGITERLALYSAGKNTRKAVRAENRYKRAKWGVAKRWHARTAAVNRYKADYKKDYANADSLLGKADALLGKKNIRRNWERSAQLSSNLAKTYKEGSKKRIRADRIARNTKAVSKSWTKLDEGNGTIKQVFQTPIEKVRNGKHTTYGREVAKRFALEIALKSVGL